VIQSEWHEGFRNMTTLASDTELMALTTRLYPICRSVTGAGLRQTLRILGESIPLQLVETPSGTAVFDWEVPMEWNIESARLLDPDGRAVVDFASHNLHILNYSEPISATLPFEELKARLHTSSRNPDWIPYKTSYYKRNWGFCLRERELQNMRPGNYRVEIDSSLEPGSLTYGELLLPGASRREVLVFAHACHPSLANDNLSGLAIATALAQWIEARPRRYSWRFVFAPATIGSLCWLRNNEQNLGRIEHGLVLSLLGDPAPWTYKRSRRGNVTIDAIVPHVLRELDPQSRVIDFGPYGYDERQLCSPGFNLPVGRLTRSVNDGYPQYHSSADDLSLISAAALGRSLDACKAIAEVIEGNRRFINLQPKGEPRLGKRGLYGSIGGNSPASMELAMLWVLNQSDGQQSLLEIAQRSGMGFETIRTAAEALEGAGLLATQSTGGSDQ
jgi:aminopeptidase-like protein